MVTVPVGTVTKSSTNIKEHKVPQCVAHRVVLTAETGNSRQSWVQRWACSQCFLKSHVTRT